MNFMLLVARAISHSFAALTREILFLPLEHKIHIFSPPCNILYVFPCMLLYFSVFPCILLYSPALPSILLYSLVFSCIPLYSLVFPCISLYFLVFSYILLYSPVFPCILLYSLVFSRISLSLQSPLNYTCQLSRLTRESHAYGLKTSISRRLTLAGQFLIPD